MRERVLYISYDGRLEPLGQSQVLAYLEKLAPGRVIHLISFEKSDDFKDVAQREAIDRRMGNAGIVWHPLRYHKYPTASATAYDVGQGSALAVALILRHRLHVVHARSYVAGLMALAAKRAAGAKFVFDMRGFWADERVDGHLWPHGGRLYRAAKTVERRLLLAADHVVTLTQAAEAELRTFNYLQRSIPPISVIPTCADLERFNIRERQQNQPFVLGYVGSVGTWYLLDEMLRCFQLLRVELPTARLLIVNRGQHDMIQTSVRRSALPETDLDLVSATHAEMPLMIARMNAGMALYEPSYSRLACAPTKLAEYLACGVPCLGAAQVGDMESVLEDRKVGVALRGFSDAELRPAVRRLLALTRESGIRKRCRKVAEDLFAVAHAVRAYARIYEELSRGRMA